MNIHETAKEIIDLYSLKGGKNYAGEDISQLEHACQAAQLAINNGSDEEVILAAFLHDIGHLIEVDGMSGYGAVNHENVGAEFLRRRGFSEKIVTLVSSHVAAKRYLCYKYSNYFMELSLPSKKTLELQGGPMTKNEAEGFEQVPLFKFIIKLRAWDEAAKEMNILTNSLSVYKKMIERHLENNLNINVLSK